MANRRTHKENTSSCKQGYVPHIDLKIGMFPGTKPTQAQKEAMKCIRKTWEQIVENEDHEHDTKPTFPSGKPASARTNGMPLLPDLREVRFSPRTLAYLLPHLVTLTCNREKPLWDDPLKKPVWWPKRFPFQNPAAGGWHKGAVARNRAEQNAPLFDILEACYEYYDQCERFGTDDVGIEAWNAMAGGDDYD